MATFTVGVSGLERVLERMKKLPEKLDEAEKRAVARASLFMEREWKKNATTLLKKGTGAYRAGIGKSPEVKTGNVWEGRVGMRRGHADKYAATHEGLVTGSQSDLETHRTGTWITPKKGQVLAIPVGKNRRRDGTAAIASSPRDPVWKAMGARWFVSKKGNLVFGAPKKKRTKIYGEAVRTPGSKKAHRTLVDEIQEYEIYFVGKAAVWVKARKPMGHAWLVTKRRLLAEFESFTRKAIEDARG